MLHCMSHPGVTSMQSEHDTHVQDGMTALYVASWKGHGPVVKLLLQTELTDISICMKVSPCILIVCAPLHIVVDLTYL